MNRFIRYVEHSDEYILRIFNRSIKCKPLDFLMPAATYMGSTFFVTLFCIITTFTSNPNIHSAGIKSTVALIVSGIISHFLKVSISRIRPFLKLENLNIKKIGIDKYSFPSGHTTAAFSLSVMMSLCFPVHSIVYILLACIVGISRMYLGVHYPSDVLAGTLIGTLSSITIFHFI